MTLRSRIAALELRQIHTLPIDIDFLGLPKDPTEEAQWREVEILGLILDPGARIQRNARTGALREVWSDDPADYPPGADLRFL